MATLDLTTHNFEATVTSGKTIILDFWAPWCGPCRAFAPTFEAVAEKFPDVVFAKVNTEQEQFLASHFQIRSIPTLMAFREQVILYSESGSLPEAQLEKLVQNILDVDMTEVHRQIAEEE